ncbi:autotransporter adhesin BigA [Salmonella enterica subsp. houtenae]|uniref:Autotransporter adhesin BigA n=1 Tax=Salmonella enterica subsp. houtenae serovar 16:z4,z32:- TaxID=1307497 RepID=A0A735KTP2_SALHO|nr:autotransporter adhesin BigA [Salmonella enterica subsp. houtenae]EDS7535567.1 autotransporter adhesin BigA [Salmonella enterica subsp. enterica]EJK3482321.1 autotransporter adhesin BigA [Salmonella enterica]ENZ85126.1 putative surface-exposed virulence protein [Salmonella enterica subsp. houtenae serovar 16:z4,z32:-- str. RKS3027]QGF84233.1 autotransporter adhesin BigA [Salmonella enterica subsp. houtenae str. CFSAN000552]HAE7039369.1 autotransporter adhesin BigA [Salmonella enterica subsp
MQRKKILAIGIALALQTSYYPAMAAENTDDDEKCPANSSSLSLSERNKLPTTCLIANNENDNHWAWVAGGVAALATGVALGVHNSDTDGNAHGNNYAPTPANDDGDDIVPPDDSSGDNDDVIPPDDGDDNVTPVDHTVKTFINSVTINKGAKSLLFDDIKLDNGKHLGGATLSYVEESDQWVLTTEGGKTLNVANWKVTDYNAAVLEGTQANGLYWKYDSRGYLILADENTTVITGDEEEHATTRGMTISGEGKTGVIISGDHTINTLSGDSTATDGAVGLVITGDGSQNTIAGNSTVDGAIGALISGYDTVTNASGEITVTGGGTAMIIDGDNITLNNKGISDISGQGSTGSIINGNNAKIANDGKMNVSDGATGARITGNNATIDNNGNTTTRGEGSVALIVDGDNTTITNEGTQSISDGATGSHVKGDDATVNMTGDITVNSGGTAMIIDGRDASVVIGGKSDISGQGSTGTVINGDKARITNDGKLNVTDGATGAEIVGDDAVIDNTGDMSIDGAGSTALSIDGNNALIISEGNQTITNGAAGTRIDGNNARIANTGDISVDGAGSSAIIIDGSDAHLTQAGDLLVTHGATGITSDGQNNTAKNIGNATVRDEDSIGFSITGKKNTFNNKGNIDISLNGTGAQISGEDTTVNLDGDINITAEKDSNGLFRGATGIEVSGNDNNTTITGNINISGQFVSGDTLNTNDTLNGIVVSGSDNTVTLDGALSIDISDYSTTSGRYINTTALDVEGTGNTVNIEHGLNISYSESSKDIGPRVSGINVNGANTVTLSGDSLLNLNNIPGGAQMLASIQNGGQLILEDDATLTINKHVSSQYYYDDYAILMADGEGSVIKNQGSIINNGTTAIMRANNGARIENSGDITSYARSTDATDNDAVVGASGKNASAYNTAGGNITLISERKPTYSNGYPSFPIVWYQNTYYAMLASDYGEVGNDAGATVSLYGAGVYGVSASKGTAFNAGDIYLDGFVPVLDDAGNIISKSYWSPSAIYLTSSAMVAGSTDSAYGDGTAINTGTITVNNAGFGMMALDGGTAINQGTITLTADEGVTQTKSNQLVGMAALNGGMVVNDTSGTINIEADYGKPFYADSSSVVVNYGQICIGGECQDSDEYNPTDSYVIDAFRDSGVITAEGETRTGENIVTDPMATDTVYVTNAGTISGGKVTVNNYGDLTNESTGSISSVSIATGGIYTNDGTTGAVSVDGGIFNNTGTVTGKTGTTVAGSVINNSGTMKSVEQWASTMNNTGLVSAWTGASGNAVLNNNEGGEVDKLTFSAAATVNNAGVIKNGSVDKGGTLNNLEGGIITLGDNSLWSGAFNNWGTVNSDADIATSGSGHTLYNGTTGVINGQITTSKNNGGSKAINDGAINIDKSNNVAMSAHGNAKMVNNGTINVGTKGTSQTNMVGMQLESDAKTDAVIENNGTINIYANNSYAFSQLGSNGHIVNNGTVYIDSSVSGSGFIKQDGKTIEGSGENGNGTETHYVDFTAPTVPTIDDGMAAANAAHSSSSASSSDMNNLSGYVVGTSADGSAGQLMVSNASMSGVEINTGFTAGTADTSVSFDNVVKGSNLTDADAIQSTSVVWTAQGNTDADGNVDVTMSKNAYVDVATDNSVSDVAQALDAGYTNNELYTSLNVGTTAELNNALKQVSGSQATTVFREARILSNRFTMLADAAPQIKEGLAFNVVAKGDPRAELGNDTQYDMLALRQKLELTTSQNLTLEYGIARLDGSGSQKAGDNGLTDGFSQFFGLKHSTAFDDDLVWNNSLRYDVHNLDSSRSISYNDTNKTADSNARQQYMELRSEGAKIFTLMDNALKVTPYVGVKFRHTVEGSYKERSAGDFNLSMNAGNETAVDSIVGLKLDYTGDNGWSATATLEGGPNLSYSKSQRTASLQGAAGQAFGVDDGQKGGGVNGLATIGVKYNSNDTTLHLDAYQWKEDRISDKGFMLNVKKTFR